MKKKWVIKQSSSAPNLEELGRQLSLEQSLVALLPSRGITTVGEACDFFNPDINKLHDPFLMKDMEKAVERISRAIIYNEQILIYGDYDVDGTSAVALLYSFLSEIIGTGYKNYMEYYIPDRYTEGYGISDKSIEYCREKGVNLLISLDCGIKAISKIDLANQYGIDVIICDHHLAGDVLPNALAILDPKQKDCPYPYKELSGCGVGLKLIQAYCTKFRLPDSLWLSHLDLVAISIASDIVDITGENRIITYYGLELINKFPRTGIKSIIEQSGFSVQYPFKEETIFNRPITVADIVFYIGPRINAAGRMKTGRESVRLFICKDKDKSMEIGKTINEQNDDRKQADLKATAEAINTVKTNKEYKDSKSIVIYNPAWFKGIIGIVASRLTEEFYRPVVVFSRSADGLLTGSARSVKEFNLYDGIDHCADLLENFGGHKFAAGLVMKEENLPQFATRFEQYVKEKLQTESFIPEIEIDMELDLVEITGRFLANLKKFAPFGPGNLAPVFLSKNVVEDGAAKIVGENHLKMKILYSDRAVQPFDAIAFNQAQHLKNIQAHENFHIIYNIEENRWNNVITMQLNVKDIKIADENQNIIDY